MKNLLFMLIVGIFLTGCGRFEKHSYVLPSALKDSMQSYYVEPLSTDTRELDLLITNALIKYGVKVLNNPKDADIIVTYIDRWIWDLTTFMVDLKIQFRDSLDRFPVIFGETKRNSLARKEASVMVNELIDEMMMKKGMMR